MKKFLSMALALMIILGMSSISILAADADDDAALSATVYITISNAGSLSVMQEAITVTDVDNDGSLTVHDALYCAHEAKYDGGAEAGYATTDTEWGLSLTKLWGVENGGSYGYYINNTSAIGLTDPVKDGDYLNAFVYSDLTAWSDKYCFFDKNTASGTEGDTITLTLSYAGYDAEWNPVVLPVESATVTVDGKATEYKTDAEGKVTITLDKAGDVVISATSDTQTLVPPVCKVSVSESEVNTTPDEETTTEAPTGTDTDTTDKSEKTGCGSVVGVGTFAVVLAGVATVAVFKRKEDR